MNQNKLPKDWKWVKITEVSDINPKLLRKDEIAKDLEIQFLPMKLVEAIINKIHLTETRKFGDVLKGSYTPFIDNDIIFAKVTPCMENGKIAIVKNLKNGIGFGSSEFHVLRSNKEISNKYLFHYIIQDRFRNEAANEMTGAVGLRRVPKQFIENSQIPLPPLETQNLIVSKIEELFSEVEKGVEDLKTAQKQLKTYRQSVLKYAFEGKLTNKKVKDGVLPKGWNIVKLDNVADITSSKRIFQNEYVSNGVPFYRTKEVKELSEGKELTIELFISNQKYEEIKSKYKIPQIGDILLSAVGTIGISYVIKDEKPFYFKDGNLMWFRDLKNINSYYLHYGLINFIKNGQGANTSGSAYNALTISTMKDFNFPLPSNEEQHQILQEIESRLSVADKMEESISQSLLQAEALRQSILKKAFSGKLV